MARSEMVLAALAAAGEGRSFSPVQVQKLFFLLDREASHLVAGPYFNFQPYDFGPFDREVYVELDGLSFLGLVDTAGSSKYRRYTLTQPGYEAGRQELAAWSKEAGDYATQVAQWVQRLSFQQLVSSIYTKYPDMKVNSVFR